MIQNSVIYFKKTVEYIAHLKIKCVYISCGSSVVKKRTRLSILLVCEQDIFKATAVQLPECTVQNLGKEEKEKVRNNEGNVHDRGSAKSGLTSRVTTKLRVSDRSW